MDELQIVTGNHGWKYIHVMLNIAEDDLDPYQYRLLGHYLRTVPLIDSGLKRPESLRDTAETCKMSVDKTKDARDQLVALGYITVRTPDGKEKSQGIGAYITILDRWLDNARRSGELVRDLVQGSEQPVRNVVQAPKPVLNLVLAPTESDGLVRDSVLGTGADSRARAESLQDSKDLQDPIFKDQEEKKKERTKKIKDSREAWMKAIVKLFPHISETAYAYAGKYISFFQGKTPKEQGGEWDKWKIDNSEMPITAVHVYAFGHWWHSTHKDMTIRKCQTIHEYFDEFLALENLEARLLHAEKLLAKVLNLPEITDPVKPIPADKLAEIEAQRDAIMKLVHTPVHERPLMHHG